MVALVGSQTSSRRPPLWLGLLAALAAVTLATLAIYPLKSIAPAVSLSVVYLPAILVIAAYFGLWLGLLTSLASAAAFNFFHIPPTGRFTILDSRNWVALVAFVLVAVVVSTMAEVARGRAAEAERRRREADLAATLARELLAGERTQDALRTTARRVAESLGLASASLELGEIAGNERHSALPLRGTRRGTRSQRCWSRGGLPHDVAERLTLAGGADALPPWWQSRCIATRCRPRRWRQRRCAAATSSRRRCCVPSHTTCGRR